MSQHEIVIKVSNLSKCYKVYPRISDRLKQLIYLNKKNFFQSVWSLVDINFKIKKGESVGIIGRNGSGKSTLLQLICRTLYPTSGYISTSGKVAALLELGSGFNPEFTGHENIFLNGAILGFSYKQMKGFYRSIIEFADIGDFINKPVKTYSSGMYVRLAFAVQACVNPDILIVDEALSVGDIFFQQKCATHMQRLRQNGTTLLFVSHDLSTIRDLCDRALVLKSGKLIFDGCSSQAVRHYYLQDNLESHTNSILKKQQNTKVPEDTIENFKQKSFWFTEPSNEDTQILGICIVDSNANPTMEVTMGAKIKFNVLYKYRGSNKVNISIMLRNRYNQLIHCSGYSSEYKVDDASQDINYAIADFEVNCMLEAGKYTFSFYLSSPSDHLNRGLIIHETPNLGPIEVKWNYDLDVSPWYGMFGLPIKVNIKNIQYIN